MTGRFTVLASGSSGNAALLEANGFGLLIDCGLHPRLLTARLAELGTSWSIINAVILTHTHGDHWKDLLLADLRSRKIPLWAHPDHFDHLVTAAKAYEPLHRAGLTHAFQANHNHTLTPGLTIRPIPVSHDSDPTFAFRIDATDANGLAWSVAYASDLGCWTHDLVEAFADVDVLAVEFNHDIKLERASPRPRFLVNRVLGDSGHLSNDQAAAFAAAIAARSSNGMPRHLVQLHLSGQCNRPELALAAGRAAFANRNAQTEIITATQNVATKPIALARRTVAEPQANMVVDHAVVPTRYSTVQPPLPGFDS